MKDERGLYYFPSLKTKDTRMYVREENGTILFRLWSKEEPRIWDEHGWIPREVVEKASALYKERGRTANPVELYDLSIAKRLVEEDRRRTVTP